MISGLKFSILGPIRAWREGTELDLGSPQQRVTLALLLLNAGNEVSLSAIARAIWRENAPRSCTTTIRTYVHRIRRVLGEGERGATISWSGGGYVLSVDPSSVDLAAFRRFLAEAREQQTAGRPDEAAALLRQGLRLWSGPTALAGLPGTYAETHRASLHQTRLTAQEDLFGLEIELGRQQEVADEILATATAHPLRERLTELAMLALYRSGRQAEALGAFDDIRKRLADELGVDPGPRLRNLHHRILRSDPGLLRPASPLPRAPYRVRPAQLPADCQVFVGRQEELATGRRLADGTAVAVVRGIAGVGKSAFAVRLAHQLKRHFPDGQLYVDLRGHRPAGRSADPYDAIAGVLEALGVRFGDIPTAAEARFNLYRSIVADQSFLIVLDNATDSDQVAPLLPGKSRSLVVVTSRDRLIRLVGMTGAHVFHLRPLPAEQARELVSQRIGVDRAATEKDTVHAIAELCAGLPLALVAVCSRASALGDLSLSASVDDLREAVNGLERPTAENAIDCIHSALVSACQGLQPDTARLFRLLAEHSGTPVTPVVAARLSGLSVRAALWSLERLTDEGLLEKRESGRYVCNHVIGMFARKIRGTDRPDESQAPARRRSSRVNGLSIGPWHAQESGFRSSIDRSTRS